MHHVRTRLRTGAGLRLLPLRPSGSAHSPPPPPPLPPLHNARSSLCSEGGARCRLPLQHPLHPLPSHVAALLSCWLCLAPSSFSAATSAPSVDISRAVLGIQANPPHAFLHCCHHAVPLVQPANAGTGPAKTRRPRPPDLGPLHGCKARTCEYRCLWREPGGTPCALERACAPP